MMIELRRLAVTLTLSLFALFALGCASSPSTYVHVPSAMSDQDDEPTDRTMHEYCYSLLPSMEHDYTLVVFRKNDRIAGYDCLLNPLDEEKKEALEKLMDQFAEDVSVETYAAMKKLSPKPKRRATK